MPGFLFKTLTLWRINRIISSIAYELGMHDPRFTNEIINTEKTDPVAPSFSQRLNSLENVNSYEASTLILIQLSVFWQNKSFDAEHSEAKVFVIYGKICEESAKVLAKKAWPKEINAENRVLQLIQGKLRQ